MGINKITGIIFCFTTAVCMAEPMTLQNGSDRLEIDAVHGSVNGLWRGESCFAQSILDQYKLESEKQETLSSESDDTVVEIKEKSSNRIYLVCRNRVLHLTIDKVYSVTDGQFSKKIIYKGVFSPASLLSVQGLIIPGDIFKDGWIYNNLTYGVEHEGRYWRSKAFVQTPNKLIDSSFASGLYFQPAKKAGLAVYKLHVNDRYDQIASDILLKHDEKGLWTPYTMDFVGANRSFSVEVRFYLFDGDIMRYFDMYRNLPEVRKALQSNRPEWLKRIKFLSGTIGFNKENIDLKAPISEWVQVDGDRLRDTVKLLNDDEYIPLTIWLWNLTGDYPSKGLIGTGEKKLPADDLKKMIQNIKAISPKIKVSLYTEPLSLSPQSKQYKAHPGWIAYQKDGQPIKGWNSDEPFVYQHSIIAPGLSEYMLKQYIDLIKEYDTDFIYIDAGSNCTEYPDWRRRRVVHTYHWMDFWNKVRDEVRKIKPDAAIWGNGILYGSLDAGFMESSYDWEWRDKTDWRNMATYFFTGALQKHQNDLRLAPLYWRWGMLGWMSNEPSYPNRMLAYACIAGRPENSAPWLDGLNAIKARWLYVDAASEISDYELTSDVRFTPCWWRDETDTLEATLLGQASADADTNYLFSMISYKGYTFKNTAAGDKTLPKPDYGRNTEITDHIAATLDGKAMGFSPSDDLTVLRMTPPEPQNSAGGKMEIMPQSYTWQDGQIRFTVPLYQIRISSILLTRTPALVYSINGKNCQYLLPANRGVRLTGSLKKHDVRFDIHIENSYPQAQILIRIPDSWPSVKIHDDASAVVSWKSFTIGNGRFALVDVSKKTSVLTIAPDVPVSSKSSSLK